MRYLWMVLGFLLALTLPVSATQWNAPAVPESGRAIMPDTQGFSEGLWDMLQKAVLAVTPELKDALHTGAVLMSAMMLLGILQLLQENSGYMYELVGTVILSSILLFNAKSMIHLGMDTVSQISEYGKLLLPVMTGALAAQGGITASAALYAGTAIFNTILSVILSDFLLPMVYLFLALAMGAAATGQDVLKNLRGLIRTASSWCLKTLLTVFTTYMSITGVISGTTDAATLKDTKVAISSVVPVVGSILSDASESVLVSAGLAKNAAGIYGIFAVLSVFLTPFFRIGIHYLVLKAVFVLGSITGSKRLSELIGDFSSAMGLLLGMTGSSCLLQLISSVCFMKGVG